jgi:Proteobacterial lipase chaperone protein
MTTQNKLLAFFAPLLVVLLYLGLRQPKIEEPSGGPKSPPETTVDAKSPAKPLLSGAVVASSTNRVDPKLVEQLRSRYGAKINNAYVQVKLIEALMRHFQKTDFLHWRTELLRAARAAFPDHYDEIEKNLDRRLEYERWMKENRTNLGAMDPEARRAAIREEREKLFGKEAADEIWASEDKNQAVNETLKEIDALEGKSMGEKVSTYTDRLEEIYEEQYDNYLEQHRHEVLNRFLSLDSVQADLTAMSAEERTGALRDIRKGLGLDEAALKRWDTLDQTRDARWEQGKKYMAERAALANAHSGAELEEKLAELRRRYFGTEAEVIAAEETSGLYRFGGPRKWGQN